MVGKRYFRFTEHVCSFNPTARSCIKKPNFTGSNAFSLQNKF